MKIAIAGAGDMAKYQTEELLAHSVDVVILTRSEKKWFSDKEGVEVRLVDYSSIDSIYEGIKDCDGVVSAILDYSMNFTMVHLNLIEAILKAEKCKKFIPSEYSGDYYKYPDQPIFYNANHDPVRHKLRSLKEGTLEWTLLNCGWLSDYFIDPKSRYIKDIADAFPVNWSTGKATIPGTGDELVSFTSARDIAKAVANLFLSKEPWEKVIFVCGETSTWNKVVFDTLSEQKLIVSKRSLTVVVEDIVNGTLEKDENKVISAEYELMSISGACALPDDLTQQHKRKYFDDIQFRDIAKLIAEAKDRPTAMI